MLDIYVRLSISEFQKLQPVLLYSEIEAPEQSHDGVRRVHGFTEWKAMAGRAISFGWDWTFDPANGLFRADWSSLRTNLMVLDARGAEMGEPITRRCVAESMADHHWDLAVAEALGEQLLESGRG